MKTIRPLIVLLLTTFILSSCAHKMTFQTSTIVPAATGGIKVKKDKNNNYAITVNVLNLAEPQKLNPSKEAYVVWMENGKDPVKKLGQITTSSGLLSKALKGELTATSVTEPTRVFITAEKGADISYPDGQIVLSATK